MMRHRLGDYGFRFDFDFDLGSLFELYFFPIRVGETVRNTDLSIEVIGSLDGDLSLFRFAGTGMRMNYLFDSPWERSTCLGYFTRHDDPPLPLGALPTRSRQKTLKRRSTILSGVSSTRHPGNTVEAARPALSPRSFFRALSGYSGTLVVDEGQQITVKDVGVESPPSLPAACGAPRLGETLPCLCPGT